MAARRSWLVAGAAVVALVAVAVVLWRPAPPADPPRPAPPPSAEPRIAEPAPPVPAPAPAPAEPVPPGEAEPGGSGILDSEGEPTRALVLASLRASIEEHLPSYKLSSEEYDDLADAVLRIRATQQRIRALSLDPENAPRLRSLREDLADAAADFEYVLEMSPAEFSARVQPGAGIDSDSDDAYDGAEEGDGGPEFLYEIPR
jgi:hypothetical protein